MKDRRDARYYRHMEKLAKRETERKKEAKAQNNSPRINLNLLILALFWMVQDVLLLLHEYRPYHDLSFDIFTLAGLFALSVYALIKYIRTKKAESAMTNWITTADYAARKAKDYRTNLFLWVPITVLYFVLTLFSFQRHGTDKGWLFPCSMSLLFATAVILTYINFKNYRKAKHEQRKKEEDA